MYHRSNSVVARARALAVVVALACVAVPVAIRAQSPAVGNRQATQVPVNVDQQVDVREAPTSAFTDLQRLPGWLEDLLTPQGREAVGLMDQFFRGRSVQTQLDENPSIRGRLSDTEPVDRIAQARGGDRNTAKLSAAGRQRAFERFKSIARTQGSARVIVELDVPNVDALTAQSVASTGANVAAAADQNLANAIRTVADRELAKLAGTAHTITQTYSLLPYVALDASEAALSVLEQSPAIIDIDEDALSRPVRLNDSMKQIGADVTRNEGFDGSGEYVVIFDTGLLASHEAFTGKDIVQACYATSTSGVGGDCPNGTNVDTTSANAAQPYPSDYEGYDHGTHVADIACGSDPNGSNLTGGGLQPNNGIWGVAPNAGLIAVQVFHKVDSRAICRTSDKCLLASSSDYIAAMNHIYSLRNTYSISSINMSLGGGRFTNEAACDSSNSSTKSAIDLLRSVGIATVIAAGNDGFCDALSSPGCISSAVAVGAVDSSDNEASFSNFVDSMLELYAPGVQIRAAVASGNNDYGNKSGTSMATPHVTGAWAVLKQNSPGASVDAVLASLQQSGKTVSGRCTSAPSTKRIQIDDAFFRHNGRLATLGSGEVAADFYWTGVPGAFFSARRLYEMAPHEIRYFYETYLEPPVLTLEYAIRNDTDVSWSGYQMQLFGADFIGLDGGNRQGPQARANNPVVPDTGFSDGDILFMTRRGRITVADSWIERDGDNATLTVMFSEPVDPGESFMLAYFVDDVGMRDKSFEMISTPLE